MTCVAWDGKTLAADKRAVSDWQIRTVTKIFRVNGMLVGLAGDFDRGMVLLDWVRHGCNPKEIPPFQLTDDHVGMLVIDGGRILKYERSAFPMEFEDKFFALGCGRDYAMAAMHLGKTACEAVQIACELDCGCGNGIDTLELEVGE